MFFSPLPLANLATQNPTHTGIALSFATGIVPAFLIGKEPHKILAATALQIGVATATNYLKENEYISNFQKTLVDYTFGSFVYSSIFHSLNDAIIEQTPLITTPVLGEWLYSFGAANTAKAFAFGLAPLPVVIASDNAAKLILQNLDTEHDYKIDDTFAPLSIGSKYFLTGLYKYHYTPDWYTHQSSMPFKMAAYFAIGMAEGAAVVSFNYLYSEEKFDSEKFAHDALTNAIDHGISCTLYNSVGDIVFLGDSFKHMRDNYPATGFAPISIAIEDTGVILREYFIPNIANYCIDSVENLLHDFSANQTHTEL